MKIHDGAIDIKENI